MPKDARKSNAELRLSSSGRKFVQQHRSAVLVERQDLLIAAVLGALRKRYENRDACPAEPQRNLPRAKMATRCGATGGQVDQAPKPSKPGREGNALVQGSIAAEASRTVSEGVTEW